MNAPLHDSNFDVQGVRKIQAALIPLTRLLDAGESFVFQYPDAEHDFPTPVREAAYQWLRERLR